MAIMQGQYRRNAPLPLAAQFQFQDTSAPITGAAGSVTFTIQTGQPLTTQWSGAGTWSAGENAYIALAPATATGPYQILRVNATCYDPADGVTKLDFGDSELFDKG